jgi:hypothetical protein|tara:strand:- start:30 stop:470 length:441 start_codon:yes stop_codon:yes gene_type:complete
MTMQLMGPHMTTTQYSRKKKDQKILNPAKLEKLRVQWRQFNKDCRKRHMHSVQFAEFNDYLAYLNGTYKAPKSTAKPKAYEPPKVRETTHYPSLSNTVGGNGTRKEPMQYTGKRKLLGIATMHKSNMVPIFEDNKHEAIEIARMRR